MLTAFDDGRLYGERYGNPPYRVLALHGWQRTHADFASLASSELSSGIVALDLAGFGATPPPPEPWGSLEYARSLLGLVDQLDGPVVVAGHSFGGRVATELAALDPGKVSGLLLSGAPLFRPAGARSTPRFGYRLVRGLHRRGLVSPERFERARDRYGSADYRAATGVMRSVFVTLVGEDYAPALSSLEMPIELVWGADDRVVPVEVVDQVLTIQPHARVTVVSGVGHMTPLEAPDVLREALGRLLVVTDGR